MAVWQYNFELFSKNCFRDIKLKDMIKDLKTLFEKVQERSENRIMLGDYESDDSIIYFHENLIDSISCRLDLRAINQEKITKLKNIVEKYDLKFLVIEEKILDGEEFIENLQNSSASKFAENPKKFIEDTSL